MLDLSGRAALVCGASRGIGRACAERLAQQNATVTLVARDAAGLQQACDAMPRPSQQHHHLLVADFNDPTTLGRIVGEHVRQRGPIEILINNTGGPPAGPILDADPQAFADALRMHVLCNQVLVRALVAGMKQRGYGRIINILSTSVRQPIPNLGVSNTIRAAVASWAKTLAGELGPHGITVNNILPGYTQTDRLDALLAASAARAGTTPAALAERMRQDIPLRRFAEPRETAAAVVFLASAEAGYITGVSLPVDGGRISAI